MCDCGFEMPQPEYFKPHLPWNVDGITQLEARCLDIVRCMHGTIVLIYSMTLYKFACCSMSVELGLSLKGKQGL
jgi:hypothetical protein